MYKKMSYEDFKHLTNELPDDMCLWLTEEAINYLKENICLEDLQNVKGILYRDFLKNNPLMAIDR